ncbi:unnamed protein product [Arabis nemorensis]|uniref:Uncharacterized protein n=1 Tax=Arabis nemorensis TaxID=586526 RepID=A0A565BZX6_9BRAS|nr:unnamed protein product [Arabis nemorensis]
MRVYNDDEPISYSSVSLAQFNSIPEPDENDDEGDEFLGFFTDSDSVPQISGNMELFHLRRLIFDAIRAYRPSIDLVTVLDLSNGGGNLQTVKHAMRLVISLLREMDRLSIVVFSTGSKRLMSLRRMTAKGQRSVRWIFDSLVGIETVGVFGMAVNDALKKTVKVIEDRRERNINPSFFPR